MEVPDENTPHASVVRCSRSTPRPYAARIAAGLGLLGFVVLGTPVAPLIADHPFTTSAGIYRIPYVDGSAVTANNDHHNHPNVPNRVDLGGGDGNTIVAAASGIIRGIVDHNGDSNDLGDGLAADLVTPQDDGLEHSCLDEEDDDGDAIEDSRRQRILLPAQQLVWIEHLNGEWTGVPRTWQPGRSRATGRSALAGRSETSSSSASQSAFRVTSARPAVRACISRLPPSRPEPRRLSASLAASFRTRLGIA